jgi:hypothetical protein
MQLSPTSYYFIPLWSKYSPQHPVLKHPQSMFLPYYICLGLLNCLLQYFEVLQLKCNVIPMPPCVLHALFRS